MIVLSFCQEVLFEQESRAIHYDRFHRWAPIKWNAGKSLRGHIVTLDWTGQWKTHELNDELSEEEFDQYWMCQLELRSILTHQETLAQGKLIKCVQIRDLTGVGLHQMSGTMHGRLQRAIQMSLNNYPEVLDLLCFLNPPWAFHVVYNMISPILSERT